eukprot:snap_masked-scaffold_18-processed-gene-6.49-mRNA-1 protein AED:1.00 eAED:1.00 QI:0/-1/0/0/-1/1/1/0/78
MKNKENSNVFQPLNKGGRLGRAFYIFSIFTTTVVSTLFVTFSVPELSVHGKPHVLTPLRQYLDKKRDEFFEIETEDEK